MSSLYRYSVKKHKLNLPFYLVTGGAAITSIALLLIPLNTDLVQVGENSIEFAFESDIYWANNIINITICVLLTFDILLDRIYGIRRNIGLFMVVNAVVIAIMAIVMTKVAIPNKDLKLFWALWNVREYILVMVMCIFLFECGGVVWRNYILQLTLFVTWSGALITRELSCKVLPFKSWDVVVPILYFIFFVVASINAMLYLRHIKLSKTLWEINEFSCLYTGFVISGLGYAGVVSFFSFGSLPLHSLTVEYIVAYEYSCLVVGYSVILSYRYLHNIDMSKRNKQTLEVRRTVVRYVSQEVRSPLQNLVTIVSLLRDRFHLTHKLSCQRLSALYAELSEGVDVGPELKKRLTPICQVLNGSVQSFKLARSVLDGLLDTSDTIELNLRKRRVYPLLEECVEIYEYAAKSARVYLKIDCESPAAREAFASFDIARLRQAIGGLLSNAIKFSDKGGPVIVEMFLVTREDPETNYLSSLFSHKNGFEKLAGKTSICIRVVDVGIGLPISKQHKLMRAVKRFHESEYQTEIGVGIGLALAYDVVKRHKGDFGIHSDGEGCGSVFWFELPLESTTSSDAVDCLTLASDVSGEIDQIDQTMSQVNRTCNLSHLHVLCVDDVASIRKVLSRSLIRDNICDTPSDEAGDGEEALKLIKQSVETGKPYDLVLMDMIMPKMDGLTATRLSREMGFEGLMVGFTGNALDEDLKAFRRSGLDDVLVKPVEMNELKNLLKRHSKTRNNSSSLRSGHSGRTSQSFGSGRSALVTGAGRLYNLSSYLGVIMAVAISVAALVVANRYPSEDGSPILDDNIPLAHIAGSKEYLSASCSLLAAAGYIAVEVAMHFLCHPARGGLIPFLVVTVVVLLNAIVSVAYSNDVQLSFSILRIRDFLCRQAFMIYLWIYTNHFDNRFLVGLSTLEAIQFVIKYGTIFRRTTATESDIVLVCVAIIFVLLFSQVFLAFRFLWTSRQLKPTNYSCVFLILSLWISHVPILMKKSFVGLVAAETTISQWVAYTYTFEVVILVFTLCHTRLNLWQYFSSSNVTKHRRRMIRHISHEMRAPLNILSICFQHFKDQLLPQYLFLFHQIEASARSVLSVNGDMDNLRKPIAVNILTILCEIRSDVEADIADAFALQQNCEDALSVLTDMSIYEMLDGESLSLSLSKAPAVKTLVNAIHDFMGTARGKKVPVNLDLDGAEVYSDMNDDMSPKYIINVDFEKITHAIRNVMMHVADTLNDFGQMFVAISLVYMSSQSFFQGWGGTSNIRDDISVLPYESRIAAYIRVEVRNRDETFLRRLASQSVVDRDSEMDSTPALKMVSDDAMFGVEPDLRFYVSKGIVEKHGGVFRIMRHTVTQPSQVEGFGVCRCENDDVEFLVTLDFPVYTGRSGAEATSVVDIEMF